MPVLSTLFGVQQKNVSAPLVVIRPMPYAFPDLAGANHKLPSGPGVVPDNRGPLGLTPHGLPSNLMRLYSVSTPVAVIFAIRSPPAMNHRLPSVPAVMR